MTKYMKKIISKQWKQEKCDYALWEKEIKWGKAIITLVFRIVIQGGKIKLDWTERVGVQEGWGAVGSCGAKYQRKQPHRKVN